MNKLKYEWKEVIEKYEASKKPVEKKKETPSLMVAVIIDYFL